MRAPNIFGTKIQNILVASISDAALRKNIHITVTCVAGIDVRAEGFRFTQQYVREALSVYTVGSLAACNVNKGWRDIDKRNHRITN